MPGLPNSDMLEYGKSPVLITDEHVELPVEISEGIAFQSPDSTACRFIVQTGDSLSL